jgi:dihydrofolate reductase
VRALVYFVAVSLDGRIADPDGGFGAFPVDARYLAELNAEWGDGLSTGFHQATGLRPPGTKWDTVVMGRGTFEPAIAAGVTSPYAHLDQYVFSTTLDPAEHPDVQVVAGDPVDFVRSLKRQPGKDIWLCGGAKLASTLADEIDRLVLKLSPVLLRAGIPLIDGGAYAPSTWRLVDHRAFDIGVVVLTYERDTAG